MSGCSRHNYVPGHVAPTLSFPFRHKWLLDDYVFESKRYTLNWNEPVVLEGNVSRVVFKMHRYKPPVEFEMLPHWAGACYCPFFLHIFGVIDNYRYEKSFLFQMNNKPCMENIQSVLEK
jgi:hypothetical protein